MPLATKSLTKILKNALVLRNVLVSEKEITIFLNLFLKLLMKVKLFFVLADCPCESYNCDRIQGSNTSVLILYSNTGYTKDQHILNPDGSKCLVHKIFY